MKRVSMIVFLVLAVGAAVAVAADDKQALEQIERDWAKAALAGDAAALDKMLAADYVFTDADASMITKKQMVDDLKSGANKYETFTVEDLKVYLHGDAAVVTGKNALKGTEGGKKLDEHLRFTDTFVKQGGRWVAVATQTTRIPKK